MTFGPNHYVPVLKVKRGEKDALAGLSAAVSAHITPLLEIVERTDKSPADHLVTAFKWFPAAVANVPRYFLDAREIAPDGPAVAADVFARAAAVARPFTPVTGLRRTADRGPALAAGGVGVAIRVTREEFEDGALPAELSAFVAASGLLPADIDLILDLGDVGLMVPAGVARLSRQFLGAVPNVTQWRTLTIVACAFPRSMAGIASNSSEFRDRTEWIAWRDALYARRAGLPRLPTFGDCAIQHPLGVEGYDPRYMPSSATIRYARSTQWLLIKGESTDVTPAPVQFRMLAGQLTAGPLSQNFDGPNHCGGCADMVRGAGGAPGLGSAGVWRRLGTLHHITRTSDDIRALAWP